MGLGVVTFGINKTINGTESAPDNMGVLVGHVGLERLPQLYCIIKYIGVPLSALHSMQNIIGQCFAIQIVQWCQ